MTPIADAMTLKIVGAWNPAIVTPHWVGREVLGKAAADTFAVGVQVPLGMVGGPAVLGLPQRYTFEGLSMSVTFDCLQFFIATTNDDEAARALSSAARILEVLPHTPLGAIGINFGYTVDQPNETATEVFGCIEAAASKFKDDAAVVQKSWSASVQLPDHLLNLTMTSAGALMQFEFNHHFETSAGAKAIALLRQENLYRQLRDMSVAFVHHYEAEGVVQ